MSVIFSRQYRPITAAAAVGEVADGQGFSVPAMRDHRSNANNLCGRSGPRLLAHTEWMSVTGPNVGLRVTTAGPPALIQTDIGAGLQSIGAAIQWFCPAPLGFNRIQIKVHAFKQGGTPGTCNLSVWSSRTLFTGATFSPASDAGVVAVDAGDKFYEAEFPIHRVFLAGMPWTFVNAQAANTDAGTIAFLQSATMWLKPRADA